MICDLLQAGFLLPLLAVARDRLWPVYIVAAIQACLACASTPAKQALLPRLIKEGQLGSGNALIGFGDNLGRLLGSPLGGLTIAAVGLGGVVAVDAASFLLSAVLVSACHPGPSGPKRAARGNDRFVRRWLAGLGLVGRVCPLRAVLLLNALGQLAQGIFLVLFVVFVLRVIRGTPGEVGLLRGVQAIGGLLGGLLVGALARRARPTALVGYGYLAFGAVALLTWNAPRLTTSVALYIGLFIAAGAPALATVTGPITTVQLEAPPEALGRAMSAIETVGQGAAAFGVLLAGLAAELLGTVPVLELQGVLLRSLRGPRVRRASSGAPGQVTVGQSRSAATTAGPAAPSACRR